MKTCIASVVLALSIAACTQEASEQKAAGADPVAVNPLSLITMTGFSGPEAEGFHDCFWIGPVSFESYNIAYPDEGAVYWGSRFQLPEVASHLEITGNYPNARYMSYNAYDKLTQPIDALLDAEIVPSSGANPFADTDKSGGSYTIKVFPSEAPADRPANTLYLGSSERRNDQLPLVFRTYVPAEGTDYTGGAGLPGVTLVMQDGSRLTGEPMCEAINSPAPGSAERELPTVVMAQDTYSELVDSPEAPAGFPASQQTEWIKFWGGDVNISRYLHDRKYLENAIAESVAGTRPKRSGFYANIHNEYIGAYIDESFGELVVLTGKMPSTPANGWDITSGDYQLRYWSLCTNESIVTTRYADCVYDSNVALDKDGNYTIVISKAVNRPSNAERECGVTWLDWGERGDGAGNPQRGLLSIRNMLGDDFTHSIQNVSSILAAEQDMGDYFPTTEYSSKTDFEARGCDSSAAQ